MIWKGYSIWYWKIEKFRYTSWITVRKTILQWANKKGAIRAGNIAQQHGTCLESMRSWIWFPIPKGKRKRKKKVFRTHKSLELCLRPLRRGASLESREGSCESKTPKCIHFLILICSGGREGTVQSWPLRECDAPPSTAFLLASIAGTTQAETE